MVAALTLEVLTFQGNGFTLTGNAETLAQLDLSGTTLTSGGTTTFSITFTPTLSTEWARLELQIGGDVPFRKNVIVEVR